MKKIIMIILLLSMFGFTNNDKIVNFTVYNALERQTDSSPLKTADQSLIDKEKLNKGELKWIAVSRDLLKVFKYGDKVLVKCKKYPKFDGVWTVKDCMAKRWKMKIDFLVADSIKLGRGTCTITKIN